MSGNSSKWLTGCAVGCGAAIALIVILGTAGYIFVRGKMQSFEEARIATTQLESRHGKIQDFTPNPDGRIRAERLRVFLAARESMAPMRRRLEASLDGISKATRTAKDGNPSFWGVMGIVGQGFGIIPEIGQFQADRARALLDGGMSMGEYCYIYVVAYYSWLGKSPEDGPDFRLEGDTPTAVEERDGGDIREERRLRTVRWIHQTVLAMLRNQKAKVGGSALTEDQTSWEKILAAEIAALQSDPDRLPWRDGLPEVLVTSLQPFRKQLEESYSAIVNPLELNMDQRKVIPITGKH